MRKKREIFALLAMIILIGMMTFINIKTTQMNRKYEHLEQLYEQRKHNPTQTDSIIIINPTQTND